MVPIAALISDDVGGDLTPVLDRDVAPELEEQRDQEQHRDDDERGVERHHARRSRRGQRRPR